MDITNRIVLITGASGGLGAAVALAMSRAGATQVLLLARNAERLGGVASKIEAAGGKARTYPVDLSDARAVDEATRAILAEVGVPDILVNNAGIGSWRFLPETAPEEIVQLMALPYFAAAWLTRAFLPALLERGTGHLVNVSSVASRMAQPGATAYISACRALKGLSDALGADLRGTGIALTHYESGSIDTPYWDNNPGSFDRIPRVARLLVPVLTPEQAARAIVEGVRADKRLVVTPFMLKLVYAVHAAAPWLVQWLMTTTGYRGPERGDRRRSGTR